MRPGYGASDDPQRITELWEIYSHGLFHKKEKSCLEQWWIMWRRVAGGLTSEQQQLVYQKESKLLLKKEVDLKELLRLLASLERLSQATKIHFAEILFETLAKSQKLSSEIVWALGRIGNRNLLYGEQEFVLSEDVIASWYEKFEAVRPQIRESDGFVQTLVQISRLSENSNNNLSLDLREKFCEMAKQHGATAPNLQPLFEIQEVASSEKEAQLGETLPVGLKIWH